MTVADLHGTEGETDESGRTELTNSTHSPIAPGTRVEVCSSFDRRWSAGFEVIEETRAGYRLRRLSDGSELPGIFTRDDIRRERRRAGHWWF